MQSLFEQPKGTLSTGLQAIVGFIPQPGIHSRRAHI